MKHTYPAPTSAPISAPTGAPLYPRFRGHRLDHAAAELLHLVMAPGWTPDQAARRLRSRVHDDRLLLRLLYARVSRAMLDRPTAIDARAHATLEIALDAPPETPPPPRAVGDARGRSPLPTGAAR